MFDTFAAMGSNYGVTALIYFIAGCQCVEKSLANVFAELLDIVCGALLFFRVKFWNHCFGECCHCFFIITDQYEIYNQFSGICTKTTLCQQGSFN